MIKCRISPRKKSIRALLALMIGGMLLLSAACAPILSAGDPPIYIQFMPTFKTMKSGTEKTKKLQVAVATPTTPAELSGDSIILLLNGREFRRLAGYRWISTIPELMQRSIIAGLESSHAFASVSAAGAGIRPHTRVLCDIDEFVFSYPEKGANPTATITATFRVIGFGTGKVLGTLPVRKTMQVQSSEVDHMATAAEKLTAELIGELNDWIITLYQ